MFKFVKLYSDPGPGEGRVSCDPRGICQAYFLLHMSSRSEANLLSSEFIGNKFDLELRRLWLEPSYNVIAGGCTTC